MTDQRRDLLRLIDRDPCDTENIMYLTSEGIQRRTIADAERDGLIIKANAISYTLTDAGRAALSPSQEPAR